MTETGHLIKRMARAGIVRERKRLKKLRRLVDIGKCTLDDVYTSFASWMGNARKYMHSFHARHNLLNLYYKLFKGCRMEGFAT